MKPHTALLSLLLLLSPMLVQSQSEEIDLDKAIAIALENNAGLKSASLKVERSELLIGSSLNINKTVGFFSYDENNIAQNGIPLNVWGVSQEIEFPTVYSAQKQALKSQSSMETQKYRLEEISLKKQVSLAYLEIVYWENVSTNYKYLDSLFMQFSNSANRRYEMGESNYLEKLSSTSKQKEVSLFIKQVDENIVKSYLELNKWMQHDSAFSIADQKLIKFELTNLDTINHPGLVYYRKAQDYISYSEKTEKQKLLPGLQMSYFQGNNNGPNSQIYHGIEAGIGIPLFYGAQKSKIMASQIERDVLFNEGINYEKELLSKYYQLISELNKYDEAINYHIEYGKHLAYEIIKTSEKAYKNGEIDHLQYILYIENAKKIEMYYLDNLFRYNQTVLELNYLMN